MARPLESIVTSAQLVGEVNSLINSFNSLQATVNVLSNKALVSAKDPPFGALGNGVADDTASLQAFVNYITLHQLTGVIPNGVYIITAPIGFSQRPGWQIQGAGVGHTIIQQNTDNTPIFNLGIDNASIMNSFGINNIQFQYLNPQPGNTLSSCILFSCSAQEGFFTNLHFYGGYYGFSVGNGIPGPWGNTWDNLVFGAGLYGGAMDWSLCINAVPNNHFGRILASCDNMVGPVFMVRGYNFVVDCIEFLAANNGPVLFQTAAGTEAVINAMKLEGGTYNTNTTLFDFQGSSRVTLNQLYFGGSAMYVTGGKTIIAGIGSGGGTGWLRIGDLTVAPTSIMGGASVFAVSSAVSPIEIGIPTLSNGAVLFDQVSAATADNTTVDRWKNDQITQDVGDADYVAALGSPNKILFLTTFGSPRTINLPAVNANLFNGLYYECIFYGAINGANTGTIICNAVTLHTQSADKVVIGYTYRRYASNPQGGWALTKYETLP